MMCTFRPDTIFTHDAKTSTLFTCDAFGMHYCSEEVFQSNQPEKIPECSMFPRIAFW
jgi:flavorubredoxin